MDPTTTQPAPNVMPVAPIGVVGVVGAGTMGAWTALWANRAGLRTTLVDAWGAGHPRAT